ncbi:hypothetical protein, partial [Streptomyces chitinivorans]|uniref:hypothetical protein n=1 Tax=Streptomyces chitinivorans TaxID=1257027 RepID=UPI0031ECD744
HIDSVKSSLLVMWPNLQNPVNAGTEIDLLAEYHLSVRKELNLMGAINDFQEILSGLILANVPIGDAINPELVILRGHRRKFECDSRAVIHNLGVAGG